MMLLKDRAGLAWVLAGVKGMADMSPLAGLILRAMRAGSIGSAGFVGMVILLELWKHWRYGGFGGMSRFDWTFLAVLVAMLLGFLALIRGITRELERNKS
jgi:hypothetical protein